MSPDKFRAFLAFLIVVALGAWGWATVRARSDRFEYVKDVPGATSTVLDRQTGTIYLLVEPGYTDTDQRNVWIEVHPQTGQSIHRALVKTN